MIFKKMFHNNIRLAIFSYFTITALVVAVLSGIFLIQRFSNQVTSGVEQASQSQISQTIRSVNSYLRSMIRFSDSLYYRVIKNTDLSMDSIEEEMMLLYQNHQEYVNNIVLFSKDGEVLNSAPQVSLKSDVNVMKETWFEDALKKPEHIYVSIPGVQRIFHSNVNRYEWVITIARAVELTKGSFTEQGVLLIDVTYQSFTELLKEVKPGGSGYLYLVSNQSEMIYHPRAQLIDAGVEIEPTLFMAEYPDGTYQQKLSNKQYIITIKSVGYTGWKLIGVTPITDFSFNHIKTKLFVVFIIAFLLFLLLIINSFISSKITTPIQKLEESVNLLEEGRLSGPVYIGGSQEIRHLGSSIQHMATQLEMKRKLEFDTLQSQINPHFLYNTLDIIVWMIENEKRDEATKVVVSLAKLFRISLSKGKSIITIKDEMEHVKNYLMIQQMRYKNKFEYHFDIEEQALELASLKLMVQPIVENAIYHGMEYCDGDGVIKISVKKQEEHLEISIQDNGLGMTPDQAANIGKASSQKGGSGIGISNVNERIKLYFGKQYGVRIHSELDEGTCVTLILPAILYHDILKKEDDLC